MAACAAGSASTSGRTARPATVQGGDADHGWGRHRGGRRGRATSWGTSARRCASPGPGTWSWSPSSCSVPSGSLDDWIKVRHRRSLGLNKRGKAVAQVAASVLFAELAVHWAHTSTALSFTRLQTPGIHLGEAGWVVFAVVRARRRPPTRSTSPTGSTAWRRVPRRSVSRCSASWAIGSSGTSPIYAVLPGLGDRPGPVLGGAGRRVPRLPVVERGAGADHHGGHRLARHRLGTRARSASS